MLILTYKVYHNANFFAIVTPDANSKHFWKRFPVENLFPMFLGNAMLTLILTARGPNEPFYFAQKKSWTPKQNIF
jgi:hypothetical protein